MSELSLNWYGMLTIHNVEQVADLLRRAIGDNRYTFVAARADSHMPPEVRTGQRLRADPGRTPITVHRHKSSVQITIGDTYGVASITSSATSDLYDAEFRAPYIDCTRRNVRISHRVPCGDVVHWIYAPEPRDRG